MLRGFSSCTVQLIWRNPAIKQPLQSAVTQSWKFTAFLGGDCQANHVLGRVVAVFSLYPDIFDANSHRLQAYALPVLDRQSAPQKSLVPQDEGSAPKSGDDGLACRMLPQSAEHKANTNTPSFHT
jgi:hypothetical protein